MEGLVDDLAGHPTKSRAEKLCHDTGLSVVSPVDTGGAIPGVTNQRILQRSNSNAAADFVVRGFDESKVCLKRAIGIKKDRKKGATEWQLSRNC